MFPAVRPEPIARANNGQPLAAPGIDRDATGCEGAITRLPLTRYRKRFFSFRGTGCFQSHIDRHAMAIVR